MIELLKTITSVLFITILAVLFPRVGNPNAKEGLRGCARILIRMNAEYPKLVNPRIDIGHFQCPNGGKYFPRYEKTEFCCDRDGPINVLERNIKVIENPFLSLIDFATLFGFQMIPMIYLGYKMNQYKEDIEALKIPIALSAYGYFSAAALRNLSIISGMNMFDFQMFSQSQTFVIFLFTVFHSFLRVRNYEIKLLAISYSLMLHMIGVVYYYNSIGGT